MKSNQYWFRKRQGIRSKDMGYGWVPISWEGWTSLGVFIAGMFGMMWYFGIFYEESAVPEIQFLVFMIIWIVLFAFFAKSRSKD